MNSEIYNEAFHEDREKLTSYAAERILRVLTDYFDIKSIVDFGGGIGVWIKAFRSANPGSLEALCIDGDYISKDMLVCDPGDFLCKDLEKEIDLSSRYDLAISLEVAEHLSFERAESADN